MQLSDGLRNHLVATGSLKAAVDGAVIRLYSGTAPATPHDAVPAGSTMLCEVSVGGAGTGVTFEQGPNAGLLLKAPGESWEGTVNAADTATWFRLVYPADADDSSTSAVRIQGTVQAAGGDMQITNPNLSAGATQIIDYFSIVMPAA